MAQVATPTITPTEGKVAPGETVEITTATEGATIYYTYGDTDPNTGWTEYTDTFDLPDASGTTNTVRAYAVKEGDDDSDVAESTFDTVGYSAAVNATYPAILDTNATQAIGAVCEGIGKSGSDGASISGQRIGASGTTTDLKYETNV
jgi:hypothetical protein